MKREYIDYVNDIYAEIVNIDKFIKGMDFHKFFADLKTSHAVVRSLEIIGEAAGKIPDDITKRYSAVPWEKIVGMRNRMAHEYFGVETNLKFTVEKIILDYEKLICN